MDINTAFDIPIEVKILNKSIFNKNIRIGKLTNSYFKDKKLWITFAIDNKKITQFKKLLKILKGLK